MPSPSQAAAEPTEDFTIHRLRELLAYEPDTGRFLWLEDRRRARTGLVAGSICPINGYRRFRISGRDYRAARLAWLYVYGVWPTHYVDHVNGNRTDDRIVNLREATAGENSLNSADRLGRALPRGVRKCSAGPRWFSTITFAGRTQYLGTFETPVRAGEAYQRAATELFGEFKRTS